MAENSDTLLKEKLVLMAQIQALAKIILKANGHDIIFVKGDPGIWKHATEPIEN